MAAMGAQAASQIEGNRMMQETVQRGMKGVEDFAARRQLAAARVQLGELKLTDPDYGQKLSGLVMDNPLAFTNEKTAGVANFAFKQAANDFQSKRENEQKMADAYRAYLYQRDVAVSTTGMRLNAQSSGMAKQNAQYAANVFRPQLAAINKSLAEVRKNKSENPKEAKYWERRENEFLAQKTDIEGNYQEVLGAVPLEEDYDIGGPVPPPTALPALPFSPDDLTADAAASSSEDFTDASTYANSAGNGAPLPPPGDSGELYLALNPLVQDRGSFGPAPRAEAVPETEVYIPTDPTLMMEDYGPPLPPEMVAPAAQAVSPTAAAVAAPAAVAAAAPPATDADAEYMAAEQEVARRLGKDKTTGAAGKMTQSTIDALVNLNPAVSKAQIEYDDLEANIGILGDRIKGAVEFSAETPKLKTELETLLKGLPAAKNKLALLKSSAEVQLSGLENPQEIIDFYKVQEAVAQDRLKRAETEAAAKTAAAAAPAAGAGTTAETPKPPPPLNDLAKRFADIETPRRVAEANIVPDTNKQWTNAKNQVVEAVGGMDQLVKITDEVFQNNVFGISLPADRARLINAIVSKIPGGATRTIKGFEQKSERSGLESVSAQEIIASLVDDVIRARGEGVSAAAAAAAKPMPNQNVPAVGNSTVIPKR
jgi:hypothetical protein